MCVCMCACVRNQRLVLVEVKVGDKNTIVFVQQYNNAMHQLLLGQIRTVQQSEVLTLSLKISPSVSKR